MDERTIIKMEMRDLLDSMYDEGMNAGIRDERVEHGDDYEKGYAAGYDEGYYDAKKEFYNPEL